MLSSGSPWGPGPDLECGVSGVGPPQPLRIPHTFARPAVSKVAAGVGDHRPRGPSPLCPREIGEWLESRPGSRTVVQLPAHHHQPLHPYSKLSPSTVLASDDGGRRTAPAVGIERTADWRVVVCPSSTGTNQVAGDPTLDICAQVQQDAPEAIECRHKPLGPYHEVGVPLENRNRARPTDPRERACGQKERGHHEVGAATENFHRELGRVIVVVRQEYPPRHDGGGRRFPEASHLLLRTVWLGGVLIEDMATAGRGRSSMLVRCLHDEVKRNCHHHCQSSLAVESRIRGLVGGGKR